MRALKIALLALLASVAHAGPPDLGVSRPINLFPSTIVSSDTHSQVAERTQLEASEAAGVARVDSGHVPPAWRTTEHAIRDAFHPPLKVVVAKSAPNALADQALRNPPSGPARTRNEPTPTTRGEIDVDEQVEASHLATRRPRNWRTVEVEVRLAADGSLESARVTTPSENARLDELALAAVKQAVERRPIVDVEDLRVARFRISASRLVVPLDLAPVSSPDATRARR